MIQSLKRVYKIKINDEKIYINRIIEIHFKKQLKEM